MGIRRRARIEHKATPITITTTLTGFRSALRSSHMASALPVVYPGVSAGTAQGLPELRLPKPGSARRPGAPTHRQFPLAPAGSPHRTRPLAWRDPLDSGHALAFRLYGRLRVRVACSRQLFSRLRARPAPCGVAPSNPAASDRSELFPRAHSLLR